MRMIYCPPEHNYGGVSLSHLSRKYSVCCPPRTYSSSLLRTSSLVGGGGKFPMPSSNEKIYLGEGIHKQFPRPWCELAEVMMLKYITRKRRVVVVAVRRRRWGGWGSSQYIEGGGDTSPSSPSGSVSSRTLLYTYFFCPIREQTWRLKKQPKRPKQPKQ